VSSVRVTVSTAKVRQDAISALAGYEGKWGELMITPDPGWEDDPAKARGAADSLEWLAKQLRVVADTTEILRKDEPK